MSLFLAILALVALLTLHLWWRRKWRRAESALARCEQVRSEQQQEALQLRVQQETLFHSIVDGLVLLDRAGRIQAANRAFSSLFGIEIDPRGKTLLEAVRLDELVDVAARVAREREVLGHELQLPGPGNRCLELNATALFDAAGIQQGTLLMFHDLTRLKQLERTREEFVANVSHELRTPLSLIKGYAETLLDGAKDDPEVAMKFLQVIERNAERLKLLIDDLLIISELESGRLHLELRSVPLAELVEKVLFDFRSQAAAREITVIHQIPALTLVADGGRMEQALCNLVENAIKYGRTGGRVVVGAVPANGGLIELFVQDDGPGIPRESLERVFERFYRVDKGRSREQGGTGLGLAIVKHIVQNHGGSVRATSEPGQGTTIFLTLPQNGPRQER